MVLSNLRDLLPSSLSRAGIHRQINAAMIVEEANRIIPAYLPSTRTNDITAVSFSGDSLCLCSNNSSARYSIMTSENDILDKLHQAFPQVTINHLVFAKGKPKSPHEFP